MCYNINNPNAKEVFTINMLTLTAKLLLTPSPEQQNLLTQTMKAYIEACNFVSAYVYKTKILSRYDINNALYYDIRSLFKLGAQMTQSTIRTVVGNYKAAKSNGHKWSQVNYQHQFYDLVWNKDYGIDLVNNLFSINTLNGRIKIPFVVKGMENYITKDAKFGTATLVNKHGKYYLHIPVTITVPDLGVITNVVGIDRGINFLVTSYNSSGKTSFVSGKEVKRKRAKFKQVRRSLQKKGTKSAKRRLKQIGSRENRWMSDTNHCIAKALVNSNPKGTLFVLEDLTGIRSAVTKVKRHDRYVSVSWSYYDLGQKLAYKAKKAGSTVIEVDPKYTSQMCPECGHIEPSNRNHNAHSFECKGCGYRSNDDRVAAINLYNKGTKYLSIITSRA